MVYVSGTMTIELFAIMTSTPSLENVDILTFMCNMMIMYLF